MELELKEKRVRTEVAPFPLGGGVEVTVKPEALAAAAEADSEDDSGDDASVVPSEAGNAQVPMTPEERRDLAAYNIVCNLSNLVLRAVTTMRNVPRLMWQRLQERYAAPTFTSNLSLQEKLITTRMQPKPDVREHVSVIEACVVQLANMGEALSEGMSCS